MSKITVRQAIELFSAISKMKDAGISVKGLKNIDLAMNKASVQPIVDGYKIASETPSQYLKYLEKLEELKLKGSNGSNGFDNPKQIYEDLQELKKQYIDAIQEYEDWKQSMKTILDEEREVTLIMISKEDLKIAEDNGASPDVLYGLLPCIKEVNHSE